MHDNGAAPLAASIPTLATVLKVVRIPDRRAFVGAFVLDARFGLNRGFDVCDDRMMGNSATLEVVQRTAEQVLAPAGDWILTGRSSLVALTGRSSLVARGLDRCSSLAARRSREARPTATRHLRTRHPAPGTRTRHPAPGTPAPGTPAPSTPAPGTPHRTPAPATPAPGTAPDTSAPAPSTQHPAPSTRSAPWFAWIHLYDPHEPYDAPEPYRGRTPRSVCRRGRLCGRGA